MTQKAAGSVKAADSDREEEISAPTDAHNVTLVARGRCCPTSLCDGCRFVSYWYKMRTKSFTCFEYSCNNKGIFSD